MDPQKMYNDKFGSTEEQNKESFKQVFPNKVNAKVEDIIKDFDLSKLACLEQDNLHITIGVPVNGNIENWTYTLKEDDISIQNVIEYNKKVSLDLAKWGYALAIYNQVYSIEEVNFELWLKCLTNTTRQGLLALNQKAPTEKYIEELTIAQNYDSYLKKQIQLLTIKNTKDLIRQAIVEPLNVKAKQLTNIVEIIKITKKEK